MPVGAWTRDRNAIVQFALTGQRIPAQGIALGTASERNRCVLKEPRIGMAGGDKAIALTIKRVIHTLIGW